MPAQWTGKLIGEIHNADLTLLQVARRAGLHPKYVSKILHKEEDSPVTRKKLFAALEELKTEVDLIKRWPDSDD